MTSRLPARVHQPYLHELVTAVRAPALALSGADGQISEGVHGAYWADRRVMSVLEVRVNDVTPVSICAAVLDADRVHFLGALRELGDTGADPTVFLDRVRLVREAGLIETVTVTSRARKPIQGILSLRAGSDFASMATVKSGGDGGPGPRPATEPGGLRWSAADGTRVVLRVEPAPIAIDPANGLLSWSFAIGRGEQFSIIATIDVTDDPLPVVALSAIGALSTNGVTVTADDRRLGALVRRSLEDLDGLTLADPMAPSDLFLAAGAPWFLTLFGRDSLWAARLLLPAGTDLAAGTLRTLARRQGTKVDAETAEEPGKIMHEIRRATPMRARPDGPPAGANQLQLPPLYYGTVDATPLWILLLHDAWRWGMPSEQVARLLPAAERALDWLDCYGLSESGFVSYRDVSGHGLANQGWKDSGDSVQFHDGSLAKPPIALCEAQGYAYAAAVHGADLLDAFDRPGADRWRSWAAELADRFRHAFWVDDPAGAYPAIALDISGQPADTVTSNIGHLLGTGLLNAAEEALVVTWLAAPDMSASYGLRTMSGAEVGFNPLAYHGGTVWTHDTAIALLGLASARSVAADSAASELIRGLLGAAAAFDYRLPELFGGHARADNPVAVPYPAACSPQAWSAAASMSIVSSILGLRADVPGGVVYLAPMHPSPVGNLSAHNLRIGGQRLDIDLTADGTVTVAAAPPGLRIQVN